MAFTVIGSAVVSSASGNDALITMDTTGADLIIVMGASALTGFGATIDDTFHNVYTPRTVYANSNSSVCIFYCVNPIVGSDTIVLSSTGGNTFPMMGVLAVSGSNVSPYESESGLGLDGTPASIQPGSLTPAESGCLIVTALNAFAASTITINSGFTSLSVDFVPAKALGGGIGWIIQGSAVPVNPTWSVASGASGLDAAMAVFKPVPAPPPPTGQIGSLMMMGVGN